MILLEVTILKSQLSPLPREVKKRRKENNKKTDNIARQKKRHPKRKRDELYMS